MDSLSGENKENSGSSKLFWVVMIIGILAFGGIAAYFLTQPTPPAPEVRLQNAVREGAPDFENLKSRVLVLEQRDLGTRRENIAGGISLDLPGVVKNFSGKTLTGLEIVASVLDEKDSVIKEKTAIVIPTQVLPIENNKSALVNVRVDGLTAKDNFSNFKFRVTGIKVE